MTYRAETSDGPDQSGPTTRREKLKAWWDHGEFEHPKTVAAACILVVAFLLIPMTLSSMVVASGMTALTAAMCVVIIAIFLIGVKLDSKDRGYARKMLLVSSAAFLVSFSIFQIIHPLDTDEDEDTTAAKAPSCCCFCPTDHGTC